MTALFEDQFQRIFRLLQRIAGDADLASDLAQEAFVRLYSRGSMPDAPTAWLLTVSLNLLRNTRSTAARRGLLLTPDRATHSLGDDVPAADEALLTAERRSGVRRVLDELTERQVQLLLLSAEGYSYRDIAIALSMNESSVGGLLLRAKREFRRRHTEAKHAT